MTGGSSASGGDGKTMHSTPAPGDGSARQPTEVHGVRMDDKETFGIEIDGIIGVGIPYIVADKFPSLMPALLKAAQAWASGAPSLSDETQKREQFEEDVWCAHKWLDDRGAPRADVGGEVFSLVGRMMRLVEKAATR